MRKPTESDILYSKLGLSVEERLELQAHAEQVASFIRLPFRGDTWRGATGAWHGAGIGSSVDFQDHRQYVPGDDPRYINWQAYARTGNYTMKLYREEVSPQLDLILDVSPSMFVNTRKLKRVLELFHFLVASGTRAGASLRCYQVGIQQVELIAPEAIQSADWEPLSHAGQLGADNSEVPALQLVPWRQHALRIIVSDLLFAGAPEAVISELAPSKARVLLLSPWCVEEQNPDWVGNVELRSCETATKRELRMTDRELRVYRQRYRQHFSLWQEACSKRSFGFARIGSSETLEAGLLQEPLTGGLVELWN